MKAVLIAINPKWVELILRGIKTIEVRKTFPNLKEPFIVYIYVTKGVFDITLCDDLSAASVILTNNARGKVVGEFVCDRIDKQLVFHSGITRIMVQGYMEKLTALCKGAALSLEELHDYIDKDGKDLELAYGWHISDLKIYDTPKELSEFRKPCKWEESGEEPDCFICNKSGYTPDMVIDCFNVVTVAPQSWRYVEAL